MAGVCHRDLHDKQLLFGPAGIALLDFDTLARGEPALDLANRAEHAALRVGQGRWSADAAQAVTGCVTALAAELGVPPARLAANRRASAVRLACVYAFRPRWHELAHRLLTRAANESCPMTDSSSSLVVPEGSRP